MTHVVEVAATSVSVTVQQANSATVEHRVVESLVELAIRGPQGVTGPVGPQGIQGVTGAQGIAGEGVTAVRQTELVTNSSNSIPSDIPGMAFALISGRRYLFRFFCTFSSAATTTGIGFKLTGPDMSVNWGVRIRQGAAGVSQMYENSATSLSSVLVSASTAAANTKYIAIIEGFCEPNESGTLQLQVRSEVNLSEVTVYNEGMGYLIVTAL